MAELLKAKAASRIVVLIKVNFFILFLFLKRRSEAARLSEPDAVYFLRVYLRVKRS